MTDLSPTSPISLLWAHQLRREHSALVDQLDQVKKLLNRHDQSSSTALAELEKRISATVQKAEERITTSARESAELRTAHREMVSVVEKLEGEVKGIKEECDRQAWKGEVKTWVGELVAAGEEGRSRERKVEREELCRVRERFEMDDQQIREDLTRWREEAEGLRAMVRDLDRKVGEVVNVFGQHDCTKKPTPLRPPCGGDFSDTSSFDLDANVNANVPAPKASVLTDSSPTTVDEHVLQRQDPSPRNQRRPLPLEFPPSLPAASASPPQTTATRPSLPHQPTRESPRTNLAQGQAKLSTYLRRADLHFQQRRRSGRERKDSNRKAEDDEEEEKEFVNAFIRGLGKKRDKQKCEKKFKRERKSWQAVKECFPNASQFILLQKDDNNSVGANSGSGCNNDEGKTDATEQNELVRVKELAMMKQNRPSPPLKRREAGTEKRSRAREISYDTSPAMVRAKAQMPARQRSRTGLAASVLSSEHPGRGTYAKSVQDSVKAASSTESPTPAPVGVPSLAPNSPALVEKQPLIKEAKVEQRREAVKRPAEGNQTATVRRGRSGIVTPSPRKKRRMDSVRGDRRRVEQRVPPPCIPILASSDDEFA